MCRVRPCSCRIWDPSLMLEGSHSVDPECVDPQPVERSNTIVGLRRGNLVAVSGASMGINRSKTQSVVEAATRSAVLQGRVAPSIWERRVFTRRQKSAKGLTICLKSKDGAAPYRHKARHESEGREGLLRRRIAEGTLSPGVSAIWCCRDADTRRLRPPSNPPPPPACARRHASPHRSGSRRCRGDHKLRCGPRSRYHHHGDQHG